MILLIVGGIADNFRCYSMRATQRATGYGGQIDGVQTSVLRDFMYQIRKV
jgi:hypothetical protein